MTISDGFKKLTLAAIGAGAITYEKTSEILGHLVEPEGDCEGGGPKGKGRSRRKACNER